MRFRSKGRSTRYARRYTRYTRRTGKKSLLKRNKRLSTRLRKNVKEEFTKLTLTLFQDVRPTYSSTNEPVNGYHQSILVTPAAVSNAVVNDVQYNQIIKDYESYAIPYIRVTFIPHAQSHGGRIEGGGLRAMGIDPRGSSATNSNINYNVETIGRWKFSKIRPNHDTPMSMVLNVKKMCSEFKEPFWNKAGTSPVYYPPQFGYLAFAWFRASIGAALTDGDLTYVGTFKTTVSVYLKNRLARE